jgi:hypothetical protein
MPLSVHAAMCAVPNPVVEPSLQMFVPERGKRFSDTKIDSTDGRIEFRKQKSILPAAEA